MNLESIRRLYWQLHMHTSDSHIHLQPLSSACAAPAPVLAACDHHRLTDVSPCRRPALTACDHHRRLVRHERHLAARRRSSIIHPGRPPLTPPRRVPFPRRSNFASTAAAPSPTVLALTLSDFRPLPECAVSSVLQ